jgi:Tfp pilus assembly protein PilF
MREGASGGGSEALAHYERAERLAAEGRAREATDALLAALAKEPDLPNARNFAGFLLTTALGADPDALERGIVLLREAQERDPGNALVLPNLGTALEAAGRPDEARRELEAAVARAPALSLAHNWLGWHHLRRGDAERAMPHLEAAVRAGGWFGPAHFNLGVACLRRGDALGAASALTDALQCEDLHDVAGAYALLAATYEARGRPRRALSALRRAAQSARWAGDPREFEFDDACDRAEEALRAAGRAFPHRDDESPWIALEAAEGLAARAWGADGAALAPTRAQLLHRVARASRSLRDVPNAGPALAWLDRVRACVVVGAPDALEPDEPFALDLDAFPLAARNAALRALRGWSLTHLAFDQRRAEEEEGDEPSDPSIGEVRRLLRARRYDEALARIEAECCARGPADFFVLTDREGDRARLEGRPQHARRFYGLALAGRRAHAAEAAGSAGAARLVDVRRAEQKLAGLGARQPL